MTDPRDFAGSPASMAKSFGREDLRIRIAMTIPDEPLRRAVDAVSEGLLDIQQDLVKQFESGIQPRMVMWQSDDIENADNAFWKHAVDLEKRLVNPARISNLEQEREWETEKLRQFAEQIDRCREPLRRIRPTTRDGDPDIVASRDACALLAAMAKKLKRFGPP